MAVSRNPGSQTNIGCVRGVEVLKINMLAQGLAREHVTLRTAGIPEGERLRRG